MQLTIEKFYSNHLADLDPGVFGPLYGIVVLVECVAQSADDYDFIMADCSAHYYIICNGVNIVSSITVYSDDSVTLSDVSAHLVGKICMTEVRLSVFQLSRLINWPIIVHGYIQHRLSVFFFLSSVPSFYRIRMTTTMIDDDLLHVSHFGDDIHKQIFIVASESGPSRAVSFGFYRAALSVDRLSVRQTRGL